jgi:probable phosphoglycerate mutase
MIALLIRHATNDSIGAYVAGRTPGLHLNEKGRAQAEALIARLAPIPVAAIYSSPLERARDTAAPLARARGLEVRVVEELSEIDYGEWTGLVPAALGADPRWRRYNVVRSRTRVPGGETMIEVQARMVRTLEGLAEQHANEMVAFFSHGDPIRASVAYYAGIPIDLALRIDIGLASITAISLAGDAPRILTVNSTDRLLAG